MHVHPNVTMKPDGEGALLLHLDTQQYFELNPTGRLIWECLAGGAEPSAITERLMELYDLERSVAREAVDGLLGGLVAEGLVVDERAPRSRLRRGLSRLKGRLRGDGER